MLSVSLRATGRRADANPSSSVPRASCSDTGPSTCTLGRGCASRRDTDGRSRLRRRSGDRSVHSSTCQNSPSGSPARAVFVKPSPPLFETEVDAPQLSNLGLQADGFVLARLELSLESGGFFLAPLELHFESDGFLLAGQQVAERGPPGSGVSPPAALREVGQQAGEGFVRGAVVLEPAGRIRLEAPETIERRSRGRVAGILTYHPFVQGAGGMFPSRSGQPVDWLRHCSSARSLPAHGLPRRTRGRAMPGSGASLASYPCSRRETAIGGRLWSWSACWRSVIRSMLS